MLSSLHFTSLWCISFYALLKTDIIYLFTECIFNAEGLSEGLWRTSQLRCSRITELTALLGLHFLSGIKLIFMYLYSTTLHLRIVSIFLGLSVRVFVFNKHENGWTEPIKLKTFETMESLWGLRITKNCLQNVREFRTKYY